MYEKVKKLQRGETIIVDELTQIYRYFDGECIVEINNGEEEFCILLDHQNKSLIYESLI